MPRFIRFAAVFLVLVAGVRAAPAEPVRLVCNEEVKEAIATDPAVAAEYARAFEEEWNRDPTNASPEERYQVILFRQCLVDSDQAYAAVRSAVSPGFAETLEQLANARVARELDDGDWRRTSRWEKSGVPAWRKVLIISVLAFVSVALKRLAEGLLTGLSITARRGIAMSTAVVGAALNVWTWWLPSSDAQPVAFYGIAACVAGQAYGYPVEEEAGRLDRLLRGATVAAAMGLFLRLCLTWVAGEHG